MLHVLSDSLVVLVPLASQSLPMQSDLEAVVKTLAPALLAELAKMKSSSSSSSSSAKKMSTTKPSEGRPSLQSSEASSATTTKVGLCVCTCVRGKFGNTLNIW